VILVDRQRYLQTGSDTWRQAVILTVRQKGSKIGKGSFSALFIMALKFLYVKWQRGGGGGFDTK
jgi:hypothetical protein